MTSDHCMNHESQSHATICEILLGIREPTPEMRTAGHAQNCINPAAVWQAMIDALLEELSGGCVG